MPEVHARVTLTAQCSPQGFQGSRPPPPPRGKNRSQPSKRCKALVACARYFAYSNFHLGTKRARIHAGRMPKELRPRKCRGQDMARDDGDRVDPEEGAREDASLAPTPRLVKHRRERPLGRERPVRGCATEPWAGGLSNSANGCGTLCSNLL